MNKYDKLWHKVNNLLSNLRAVNAVTLVGEYYEQFSNKAPAELTQSLIDSLQKDLDDAV